MLDSNGKPVEAGRLYALSQGSRTQIFKAEMTPFGRFSFKRAGMNGSTYTIQHHQAKEYTIERAVDWTARNAQESRLEQLREIEEQRDQLLAGLDVLEKRTAEILFGGYTEQSRDEILGFVRDGRGSALELLQKVQAGT